MPLFGARTGLRYHAAMTVTHFIQAPPLRARSPAIWAAAVAGAILSVALLHPGQYPFDSAYQLWQARTGEFSNITPVAIPALWSVLLALGGDAASLLLLNIAMLWTGLALVFDRLPLALGWRLAGLLACGLAPGSLVQLAHLLSDAHLAAVLVLACGLAIDGGQQRRGQVVVAAVLLVYAGCVRHNAVLAVVPFGALLAAIVAPRRHVALLAGALGIAAATIAAAQLLDRTLADERRPLWPMLVLWDLAAVSVATGELLLPDYTHGPGLTVDELRETGAFDPTSAAPLFARSRSGIGSGLGRAYPPERLADLRARWFSMLARHPQEWITHRLRTFATLVGPHRYASDGVAYYVDRQAYRDNPPLPEALAPRAQRAFYALAYHLQMSGGLSARPWLGLLVIAVLVAWRRRSSMPGAATLAIASSALLYAGGFLVLAPSTELRYLTWPIVAAPLAFVLALASRRPAAGAADHRLERS
jgi:hypothetical protein